MRDLAFLLAPPVAFLVFLLVALGVYALGSKMAPKLNRTGGKLTTYACGENLPGMKVQFGYRIFFYIALFFTIMHVAALVIATMPAGKLAFFAIFYLLMIFIAVLALITRS